MVIDKVSLLLIRVVFRLINSQETLTCIEKLPIKDKLSQGWTEMSRIFINFMFALLIPFLKAERMLSDIQNGRRNCND